jgi:hypothetical protein
MAFRMGRIGFWVGEREVRREDKACTWVEARRVSCSVRAVECFKSERRASRVVGFRSNGGMGCGWKSGAKKALISDHAIEIDAASAALEGDSSGLGKLSI